LHQGLPIGAFLVCVVLITSIARMAQRALVDAEAETIADP